MLKEIIVKPALHIDKNITKKFEQIIKPLSPITPVISQKTSLPGSSLEDFNLVAGANLITTTRNLGNTDPLSLSQRLAVLYINANQQFSGKSSLLRLLSTLEYIVINRYKLKFRYC